MDVVEECHCVKSIEQKMLLVVERYASRSDIVSEYALQARMEVRKRTKEGDGSSDGMEKQNAARRLRARWRYYI